MKVSMLLPAAFVALLAFTVSCRQVSRQEADTSTVYEVTDNALLTTDGLPMVADFSADWCPPCRKLAPVFDSLKNVYAGSIDFVTFNVDSVENLARHYNITAIPTLLFIAPDGTVVHRMEGYQDAAAIQKAVSDHLD